SRVRTYRETHQETANGRVRIVIADDDPQVLHEVALLLESRFDVVGRAGNGVELIQAVQTLSPAVVVTDIAMPHMSGIEAARRITTAQPDVKVVMLSIFNDCDAVQFAFEAGASAYVVKLRASSELIPAIGEVLAGRPYRPNGF